MVVSQYLRNQYLSKVVKDLEEKYIPSGCFVISSTNTCRTPSVCRIWGIVACKTRIAFLTIRDALKTIIENSAHARNHRDLTILEHRCFPRAEGKVWGRPDHGGQGLITALPLVPSLGYVGLLER